MPKFMQRKFGTNIAFGTVATLNPIIIIFCTPIVQFFTANYPAIKIMIIGSWITGMGPFVIWTSDETVGSVISCIILISVGEALWSPRMYDYLMKVAPQGRERTFIALASIPLFLSQIPVGILSGWVLTNYCPSTSFCDGSSLWLVIGLVTSFSPSLMMACYKCIYDPIVDDNSSNTSSNSSGNSSIIGDILVGEQILDPVPLLDEKTEKDE